MFLVGVLFCLLLVVMDYKFMFCLFLKVLVLGNWINFLFIRCYIELDIRAFMVLYNYI